MELTTHVGDREYQQIRVGSMRGRLNAAETFWRDSKTGEVTFETHAPLMLCDQLERLIDFGATTARDVLGVRSPVEA